MRWILSSIAALLLVVFPVSAAAGHAGLAVSSPEDGAALDIAPEEVVLTFTEELLSDLVEISVLDADDTPVVVTEVPQTPPPGTDVKVPWPADLPPGEYSVAFRVVSADGHPVTGRITFSYANAREIPGNSSPSEDPALAEPSVEATTESPQAASPDATFEDIVPAEGEPDGSIIGPLLIAGAVIVGIGVVISIVMLARSRQ